MTRNARGLWIAVILALAAIGPAGCVVPKKGQELFKHTLVEHIPGMKDRTDRILKIGCKFRGGTITPLDLSGRCDVALSNGVSDLANDLHTAFDVVDRLPGVNAGEIERMLLSRISSECTTAVRDGLNDALRMQKNPTIKALVKQYIDTRVNVASICSASVRTLWDETNDNTYSTGHKCAAMHLDLKFKERGVTVSRSTYTIHETERTYPGCPRDKLHVTPCVTQCLFGVCRTVCQTVAKWGNN